MRTRATVLLVDGNKLLVIERTRNGEVFYVLPGGKVEEGETPAEAAVRELYEEASIRGEVKEKIFDFADEYNGSNPIFLIKGEIKEPELHPKSIEMDKQKGSDFRKPMWIPAEEIKSLTFFPLKLKEFLINYLVL